MSTEQHKSHLQSYLQNHKDRKLHNSPASPGKYGQVTTNGKSTKSDKDATSRPSTSKSLTVMKDRPLSTRTSDNPSHGSTAGTRSTTAGTRSTTAGTRSTTAGTRSTTACKAQPAEPLNQGPPRQRLSASAKARVAHRQQLCEAKLVYTRKVGGIPIDWIPDEILLEIFQYFAPQDLLSCGRVCKRWHILAADNLLWQHIYKAYAKKVTKIKKGQKTEKPLKVPKDPPASYWKSYCVQKGAEFRNSRAMKILQQKKTHPFTGLQKGTQDAIKKSGLRFVLSFVDDDQHEHTVYDNDVFYFNMSLCVRWYDFQLPSIYRIKKLKLYSGNPIFFDDKGQALPNSPLQRSILYEREFRLGEILSGLTPLGSDDIVNVYDLGDGLTLASWKDEKNLAYITMNFHSDHMTQRCLLGNSTRPWMREPHRPFTDDIDSKYGLHSYSCTLELRNMRTSFWSQQFMNLHCLEQFIDGHAVMQLIDPDRSFERSWVERKIYLPWKTDALKGIVQGLCMMDITLLDDQNKPIWCSSGLTKIRTSEEATEVTYEYDGDYFTITYTDPQCGRVIMILIWEESSKKFYITSLQLHLSLSLINYWFARRY